MAYEKTTWATGDIITADKLNHAEAGIENASVSGELVFNTTDMILEASYNDIISRISSGIVPWICHEVIYEEISYNQISTLQEFHEITPTGGDLTYIVEFFSNNPATGGVWLTFFSMDPDENMLAD